MSRSGLHKTGDWNLMRLLTTNLDKELKASQLIGLRKMSLKMEGTAKKHMARQDLSWPALSPSTLAQKAREGLSEKTLIATSTYFQSITSFVKDDKALAGVRRKAKTKDGQVMADIAKVHEFGSRRIPKRPLWLPTFIESLKWYAKNMPHLVEFRKRLTKYRA